jgi:pantothenate kinase
MNIISIIGEPGTGKTTLMFALMKQLNVMLPAPQKSTTHPLVTYHDFGNHIYILGKYEESKTFSGTDALSMACQPQVVGWLETIPKDSIVIMEGDRLGNASFLMHCAVHYELLVYYLDVPKAIREQRYLERGSNQSEKFLKGRETKYAGLRTNFLLMDCITTMQNNTPEHTTRNVAVILGNIDNG